MKTNFKTLVAVVAIATFPLTMFAQSEKSGFNLNKKYVPGAAASYATGNDPKLQLRNDIPIRTIRNFIARFNEVTNLHWYSIEEGFIARFIADSVETRAEFDTKGFWKETINTYNEDNIPVVIKDILKYGYPDFRIIIGYKIETTTVSWYVVKIENEKKLRTLQIKNGETEITGDYIKQ